MNAPLISVVIPAYNRSKTIGYCLDSIVRQTYKHFEVIVVDDCSTDDTVSHVRAYPDSRVRCVVLDKNSGAQAARNRGIREAKGEWIAFQDSDDEWMSEKLQRQVDVLSKQHFDTNTVVHTNALIVYDDGREKIFYDQWLPIVEGNNVYAATLRESRVLFQGLLVSKDALTRIELLDEKVIAHQEWDTSIRLAKHCKFIYIKEPCFKWHIHSDEAMSKNKSKDVEGYCYVISKHKNEIKEYCGTSIWNRQIYILLKRCMDFDLWECYDHYYEMLNPNVDIRIIVLSVLRIFRIRPMSLRFKSSYQGIK